MRIMNSVERTLEHKRAKEDRMLSHAREQRFKVPGVFWETLGKKRGKALLEVRESDVGENSGLFSSDDIKPKYSISSSTLVTSSSNSSDDSERSMPEGATFPCVVSDGGSENSAGRRKRMLEHAEMPKIHRQERCTPNRRPKTNRTTTSPTKKLRVRNAKIRLY